MSSAPQGYNKATRMVGGRVLTYRPSAPVRGSSRWLAAQRSRSGETGFVDTGSGTYNFNTTGTINLIATIAQGASVNQRVGKKIALKSVQIRGNSQTGTTTTAADCALMLVYDRRPTGVLPAITDILTSADTQAFNNDANSGRFQILMRRDWVHTGNITTPATGNEFVDRSEFISLKGLPTVYKAAGTGAIADIEQGALYAVSVGSNGAGTAAPFGTLNFRTRFVDI